MTEIVANLKAVKEVDARIAALDGKIDSLSKRILDVHVKHQKQVDAWTERANTAFENGSAFDENKPVETDSSRVANALLVRLRHDRERLFRERLKAIASGGPDVLDAASKAVEKALSKAAPLLAELDGLLRIIVRTQSEITAVVDAANATNARTLRTDEPDRIDIGSLAAAVAHGSDPLAADKDRAHKVLGLVWDPDSVSDRAPVLVSGPGQQVRDIEEAARGALALGLQRAALRGEPKARPLGYRPAGV